MEILDSKINIMKQINMKMLFNLNYKKLKYMYSKKKLVHYTSASVAREIIEKEQLWLRKTIFMNDYSEIKYGKKCLDNLLNDPEIKLMLNNILKLFNTNLDNLKNIYHIVTHDIKKIIYISCFSEHLPEEDNIGRLSMWRAYGNSSGVALVINSKLLVGLNPSFLTIPVIYSEKIFKENFLKILKDIDDIIKHDLKNSQQLNEFSSDILNSLSYAMYIYIIILKHQGFWEEREWRIILSLFFEPLISSSIASNDIERSIENIKGNPEVIYKLNLNKLSFINPKGESFLEKIIIGPTANSEILIDSFSEILRNKGFDDEQIKNMITVSNIPLRY
ncbi:DUF2971 domain-containing protein [Megamonas funiformis]|uniref:DUF2971 domain-containing protein n=1 Tax=Megamonas funiformis YIT 11815 TaxID=742816 RepID=A0ABN0EKA7_9FIRM|nr:DUF2971 domain-containing protein [Megamonas funiformis]EHR38664.1 hypothetical protein HMPREF9454_00575 [Megamonas funiformis YIT 11815]QIB60100.1 DUF2971 domain-containing protein [Megamonas funiformis]